MNKEDDDNKTCCELSSCSRTLALNGQECLYLEGIDPNGIVSLLQTREEHYPTTQLIISKV